jgi:hypothetical protein
MQNSLLSPVEAIYVNVVWYRRMIPSHRGCSLLTSSIWGLLHGGRKGQTHWGPTHVRVRKHLHLHWGRILNLTGSAKRVFGIPSYVFARHSHAAVFLSLSLSCKKIREEMLPLSCHNLPTATTRTTSSFDGGDRHTRVLPWRRPNTTCTNLVNCLPSENVRRSNAQKIRECVQISQNETTYILLQMQIRNATFLPNIWMHDFFFKTRLISLEMLFSVILLY